MELHNLKPAAGSLGKRKRLGRGQGSTDGGTSGRGHKGAKSRSGYKQKLGFEGGQMPLQRRMPKVGFKNFSRVEYKSLNLNQVQDIIDGHGLKEITVEVLREKGLLGKNALVKVLGNGELKSKVNITVHAISGSAKGKIEGLGGTVTIVK
ncbi:MAG TPA: 50S ribosomal protein L15 [Chitinophagales bacterium]|nr:50S ribosomal protein L15 [Chitinophagales bacterium]